MSAVLAPDNLAAHRRRRMTELEATRQMSRIAANAADLKEAFDHLARVALAIPGICRIEVATNPEIEPAAAGNIHLACGQSRPPIARAVGGIVCDGKTWGELRIYFDLPSITIDSPVRFVEFAAQQIGGMLTRFELLSHRNTLQRKCDQLRALVAKRKAIHRATAVLVHTHRVSEGQAFSLLCNYARESGNSLQRVAEAIVLNDRQNWRRPRTISHAARHFVSGHEQNRHTSVRWKVLDRSHFDGR